MHDVTPQLAVEKRSQAWEESRMLRVLTLASLFPSAVRPVFGVFVERQTLGLAAHRDVALRVVNPIGLPPGPLKRHVHYRAQAALPARETWKGLEVHRPAFPVIPRMGERFAARLMARALLPVLQTIRKEFPFDVIDAEFFWPDGPAAVRLGRALGVPVSIKARGSDIHQRMHQPAMRSAIVAAARAADGLLAVSGALKADMVAIGMPAEKIRVHYTGVDMDRFRPATDRAAAKAALGVQGPLLLSVGALIALKGHDLVLDAIRELPEATLMIAGEGPHRPALEARIAAEGLGERVRLLGAQPHEAMPALIAAADMMVLASAAEGLANAWVESLASGTPIVIPDVGGAREVVDRPEIGRLVAREPAAIARGIRELLAAPPLQDVVRASAERFTWAANSAALYEHLAGLAAGRGA
ncbi:glycosyltransferase [Flavisphingomonas formosensis]